MPKKDFDNIIQKPNGNPSKIENYLGLDKGSLSNSNIGIFFIPRNQLNN